MQPIVVKDLKDTRAYTKLCKAFNAGLPPPALIINLSEVHGTVVPKQEWAPSFEEMTVHVERVIAYWSWTLKPAEMRYSATEREVLAAKECLVKFKPFIEGEALLLVTDHAAL